MTASQLLPGPGASGSPAKDETTDCTRPEAATKDILNFAGVFPNPQLEVSDLQFDSSTQKVPNNHNQAASTTTAVTTSTATNNTTPNKLDTAAPTATNAPPASIININNHRDQSSTSTAFRPTTSHKDTSTTSSQSPDHHYNNCQDQNTASNKVPASSSATNLASSSSSHNVPASAVRKTSPGLAARLKALGFGGTSKKADAPSITVQPPDRIGRLDEYQLRQLDEKHQAGSLSSVISRRGRPWKGASPSVSPTPKAADEPDQVQLSADIDTRNQSHPQLPEIRTPEPLDMDTQKYRLPDHTNGNGTKVTLDTRREHLERSTLPPSPDDVVTPPPPPPPPKDTPPVADAPPVTPPASDYVPGLNSYFTPGHNRPGSIYTLSRASFANQLAQLTSLQLPDAESLSSKVSAIRTAQVATRALINAAEQIRSWISKALEVIEGLDSEDDVEWAAAGGREGLAEVESAIDRFSDLINVYVGAIEELQGRTDIANVEAADLKRAVSQMEAIIGEWGKIRSTLQTVRTQVEIAMEWEELWNSVLGDIQGEMDELSRLVFEMEERRHKSIAAAASGDSVDIGDLETIVEETPAQAAKLHTPSRSSLAAFPMTPTSPGPSTLSQDDSSLLALFARMQPLRASLDFLPMRLSPFQMRAETAFPTACEELEMRRTGLDASYKKLEKDAEVLRKELGEDRWVIVFRGAGRQAQKMHESVERSLFKLKESIDAGTHLTNPPAVAKKMESYEAKKTHYGPAIERVLAIIDRGVKDRLTVNGEILRLHTELQTRWKTLKAQIQEMDVVVEDIQSDQKGQHLRDSLSSMLSNDRSTLGSGRETPGSSPPSSVVMSSLGFDPHTPMAKQPKARSSSAGSRATAGTGRRLSSLPAPTSQLSKKPGSSRLSTIAGSSTATPASASRRSVSSLGHRPAWNRSTNTGDIDTGHNFKPLSVTTPSPYAKKTGLLQKAASSITPSSAGSKLPTRSPFSRATSESPRAVEESPSRPSHSRLSFRERLASPGPYAQPKLAKPRLSAQSSASSAPSNRKENRRASYQPSRATSVAGESQDSRPASSLGTTARRTSLLPQPRGKRETSTSRDTGAKPAWR